MILNLFIQLKDEDGRDDGIRYFMTTRGTMTVGCKVNIRCKGESIDGRREDTPYRLRLFEVYKIAYNLLVRETPLAGGPFNMKDGDLEADVILHPCDLQDCYKMFDDETHIDAKKLFYPE